MTSNLKRRGLVFGALALGAASLLPRAAAALTTDQARTLVNGLVGELNGIINSGRSEQQMFGDFERLFTRYADVNIIARSALGVTSRSASASQMRAFTEAFRGYLSRKYGKRFREFIGGRLEVNAARKVKSFYEVKTTAFLSGSAPFDVTFLVSDKSGRDLFFNMYIEGINMLATEQTEVGAMLDRRKGNLDALIQDLRKAG